MTKIKTTDDQEELFVLVDKNDKVIGRATRRECHSDPTKIHQAVHVIIENNEGEIFLQRRSLTKDSAPGWYVTSASGHVTFGLTPREASIKEIIEELGVNIKPKFVGRYIFRDKNETEMIEVFKAESEGPFKLDPVETSGGNFFTPESINKAIKNGDLRLTERAISTLKFLKILN
ncbi:hypothetical protein A3D84_05725 [Candidatus Woesebacteria bacterium RIFCSPHIGHO2_02_FULL_42_20]|nr:MAG: hypothetical protein A2873_00410 [Candidatus Woesebacteria bacterium RIFCSPHIGHO2_01_FULL_42_80]OGM35449.1 MAG: hypothetical protein A3D84_05725 [Candidatus Woesebacteria bacterium RIFCSPHIGHO2_02_FULL_42_20]OGM66370.1 MAG: hypothetical protein A2969_00330 [Candidatus Woesebacteria bacterium RIFCSPLOWO2_01_FULL_42_67]